eukprot:14293296-Ditylum_brightwellii.AAC.1
MLVCEVGKIKYEQKNGIAAGQLNAVYEEGEHVLTIMQGFSKSSPSEEVETKDNNKEGNSNSTNTSTLSPAALHCECKCAACVEELKGETNTNQDNYT